MVCGESGLALRLLVELLDEPRVEVTAVIHSRGSEGGARIAGLDGVRLVEASKLTPEVLRRAGVADAHAVALVDRDDVGNTHAALRAQEINPGVRLVMRFSNMSLGYRLRPLLTDCVVLSHSATAAPALVAAALGEVAPSYARLPGRPVRTVFVARRSDVPPSRVICGLVRNFDAAASDPGSAASGSDSAASGGPVRLPADQDSADVVLAHADGSAPGRRRRLVVDRLRPGLASLRSWASVVLNRKLVAASFFMVALMLGGTVLFSTLAGHSWAEALYLTVLDAAGAAQPELRLSTAEKVVQALVTLTGIALVPVVTAAVVDGVVRARLTMESGRPRPVSGHVVVIGLGVVGGRVLEQLRHLGTGVVGVERNERAIGVRPARRLGVPVVIGSGGHYEVLREAYVHRARALVAVTDSDVVNLEAILNGRRLAPDLRVVLRLGDDDLAERVREVFGIAASSSVSQLAAPTFAAAMLGRHVLATIPVGRRVLLLGEVAVQTGSAWDGAAADGLDEPERLRVLAVQPGGDVPLELPPPPGHRLAGGDRLVVVGTRRGFAHATAQCRSGP